MDGLMLNLSNEVKELVAGAEPKATLEFQGVVFEEYQSKIGDKIFEAGFLNVIARYANDVAYGFHIETLGKLDIAVQGQPKRKHPNMSYVVGMSKEDRFLNLKHWDGFETIVDCQGFELVEQRYTK